MLASSTTKRGRFLIKLVNKLLAEKRVVYYANGLLEEKRVVYYIPQPNKELVASMFKLYENIYHIYGRINYGLKNLDEPFSRAKNNFNIIFGFAKKTNHPLVRLFYKDIFEMIMDYLKPDFLQINILKWAFPFESWNQGWNSFKFSN